MINSFYPELLRKFFPTHTLKAPSPQSVIILVQIVLIKWALHTRKWTRLWCFNNIKVEKHCFQTYVISLLSEPHQAIQAGRAPHPFIDEGNIWKHLTIERGKRLTYTLICIKLIGQVYRRLKCIKIYCTWPTSKSGVQLTTAPTLNPIKYR